MNFISTVKEYVTGSQPNIVLDKLPESALVKQKPEKVRLILNDYLLMNTICSIKIINHTHFNLRMNLDGFFTINDKITGHKETLNCKLVAYCLEGNSDLLCFDRYTKSHSKKTSKKNKETKFEKKQLFIDTQKISSISGFIIDSQGFITKLSEKACFKKKLIFALLGLQDKGSFFSQTQISIDIFWNIAFQANRWVNSEFRQFDKQIYPITEKIINL